MVREVPRKVPDNCAYEAIVEVFGLRICAYYMVDT